MEFSRVERAAIEAILSKPEDGMEVLRTQFAAASVVERDYTGVGFYTTISVPPSVPPMPDSEELREELFVGAGGSPGVDFRLWTYDGYLACLEGYTIHRSWPNEDEIEEIAPSRIMRRADMDGLMPDCESRFETRWPRTVLGALLEVSLLLAFLVIAAIIAVIAHHFLMPYTMRP